MKPIGFYSSTELAKDIEQQYGSHAQSMPLHEMLPLCHNILQLACLGEIEDLPTAVFLTEKIKERMVAGERMAQRPLPISF